MIALLLALLAAAPAPLSVAQYRARLEHIDGLLAQGDRRGAAREADALLGQAIDSDAGPLAPDRAALAPVANAEGPAHRTRLQLLLRSLDGEGMDAARAKETPPDPAELEPLRAREQGGALEAGGQLQPLEIDTRPMWKIWADAATRVLDWLGDRIRDLLDWLSDSFRGRRRALPDGSADTNTIIFIATGFVVAAVLLLALRARFAKPPPAEDAPAPAGAAVRDDDPLSRGVSEWEERARELARAGRAREAIRAWYHALLVACYRSGLLHHRRGRTNWEYAAALSAATPWRPRFLQLTRWFDEEWYGRRESSDEALALFEEDATLILSDLRERAR